MAISREFPACSRLHPFGYSKSDHICHDLLLLILNWFPVQTLLVCRTVCKSWKQIIDSTSFILDHLAQTLLVCRTVCKSWKQIIDSTSFILDHLAHQRPRILLQNSFDFLLFDPNNRPIYDTVRAPDGIDLGSQPSNLRAVCTVHGVVCLYDNGNNLFLWNPSIRRHMRIPLPPPESSACGNTEWYKYCGFWMDSCTKEFKIVIFYIGDDEHGGCLFSSRDQKWQEIPVEEMAAYNGDNVTDWQSPQVMIHGVAHWVTGNSRVYYGGSVVWYDFVLGDFGQISLPEIVNSWGLIIYVSKWDDSLSIVVAEGYPIEITEFELWVFKNGLWSKMVMFNPVEGVRRVFCVLDCCTALASTSDEELVLYDDADDGSIIHLCSRKDGYIPLNLKHGDSFLFSFAYDFVESLLFPDQLCIYPVINRLLVEFLFWGVLVYVKFADLECALLENNG